MVKKGKPFTLDSGEPCVTIPNSVIKRNHHRWEAFIIAQFSGNSPSTGALHAIANSLWSPRIRDISVSRLTAKACLLKIPNPVTRNRILSQGIWHIERQAMFVAKWEPGLQPTLPELTTAPVWLEFRNVPPQFYSEEGLEYIAGLVGDPLYLHHSTANMVNLEVAKVFTIIDPSQKLPEAVHVRFETGHVHRIEVHCPWLPPTCSFCKTIGHTIKRCPDAPITCNVCNSTGHKLEDCSRRTKVTTTTVDPQSLGIKGKQPQATPSPLAVDKILDYNAADVVAGVAPQPGRLVLDIGLDNVPRLQQRQPSTTLATHGSTSSASTDLDASMSELEEDTIMAGQFTEVLSRRSKKQHKNRSASRGSGSKHRS